MAEERDGNLTLCTGKKKAVDQRTSFQKLAQIGQFLKKIRRGERVPFSVQGEGDSGGGKR